MAQQREGFYDSPDEARAHIELVYEYHPHLRGMPLMMNYHFGSVGRYKLETLIDDLVNDGFSRLDPFFIDADEYADPGRPDHWWIPSKVALYTPVTLIQEVQKYDQICAQAGIFSAGSQPTITKKISNARRLTYACTGAADRACSDSVANRRRR